MAWDAKQRAKYNPRRKGKGPPPNLHPVPVKLLDVPYAKRRKSHKEKLELIRDSINQTERGREELLRLVEEGRVQVGVVRPALDEMFRSDGETLCDARLKVICFVRMCADSNRKLGDMVDRWDALSEQKQEKTTLDELCQAVGLPAVEFIEIFAPRAYDLGFNLSKMFVGMAQPEIVKKSIEAAMDTKTGFAERRMLLQAGGTVPSSKGGLQLAIHNTQVNTSELPDFDSLTLDLADAVRGD